MTKQIQNFQENLLAWYDLHGRKNLPWQVDNPYFIWVSEIMLQQTQVVKVIDYFNAFINRFPTIDTLAESQSSDVLQMWSGLGYYNRARNIHKTAVICCDSYNSQLPKDIRRLMDLPGIGQTTAGAILSLAYNLPYPILDGNVKRVISRIYKLSNEKLSVLTKKQWQTVEKLMPQKRAGNYNQALMDLGSMVCTRSKPLCDKCPLVDMCNAFKDREIRLYPQKRTKIKQVAVTLNAVFFLSKGKVYLQQLPAKGIWAELWFLPLFDTSNEIETVFDKSIHQAKITHILSHRILTIKVSLVNTSKKHCRGKWFAINQLDKVPHPSSLDKILKLLEPQFLSNVE